MKTYAVKEKRTAPAIRRSQPSHFGYRGPEVKAQQEEIRRILHSTDAQAKLNIGQPNNKYEQEADRVADQVMRMSDADVAQGVDAGTQSMQIQRTRTECEEETAQRQPEENEDEEFQAKSKAGKAPEVTPAISSGIESLQGGGQPLPRSERSFFEPRFGADFSKVRVHNCTQEASAVRAVNARAFTIGRNVVFGTGEFSPNSSSERKLLAHELTHVLQQSGGKIINVNNSTSEAKLQGSISYFQKREQSIQRIPKNPAGVPFDAEIIPWSAALRSKPKKIKTNSHKYIIADLPKKHRVRVLGGKAWVFVKTHINGKDQAGYVSHELLKKAKTSIPSQFLTDEGNPISVTSEGQEVPPFEYEKKWMKDQGLAGKVNRIPNSATKRYNCHGFVYLNANAWLNDPTVIIRENEYIIPKKPGKGDAIVYTKSAPSLDGKRRPTFSDIPPHSGIVTKGSPGSPEEATSKWGSWHLYRHNPADVWSDYGSPTFLRSNRAGGHTIKEKL